MLTKFAIEHVPVEIVDLWDLPTIVMVIFQFAMFLRLPGRVDGGTEYQTSRFIPLPVANGKWSFSEDPSS